MLPPPEATLGHLPAPGTPLQAEFRPEPVASKAQHSERVALCAENLSKQQQQQQTAMLPPPSQTAQVPGAADGEQLHFAARKWQQETIPAGGGAALQYLSPLGPEAAFVQPRSSFEAKWGRWCVLATAAALSAPGLEYCPVSVVLFPKVCLHGRRRLHGTRLTQLKILHCLRAGRC